MNKLEYKHRFQIRYLFCFIKKICLNLKIKSVKKFQTKIKILKTIDYSLNKIIIIMNINGIGPPYYIFHYEEALFIEASKM